MITVLAIEDIDLTYRRNNVHCFDVWTDTWCSRPTISTLLTLKCKKMPIWLAYWRNKP